MAMDAFDRATAVVGQNVDAKAINHFIDVQDGHAVVYAYPKYYRNGGGILEPSRERFVPGKSGFVFEAVEGVHRARVASNGTIRMEHLDGTIDQKIVGIAAVNPVGLPTKIWQIDLAAWARTMTENRIVWTHPDGYRYEIVYSADALTTRLTIPPSAFAKLRAFLPPGAVAFGPILDWDERGLETDWTCSQTVLSDSVASIDYRKGGKVLQSIRSARVGGDALDDAKLGWAKRRIRDKTARFLVESIPVVALEGKAALVFNDSVTYQQGVSGYTGCGDTILQSASPSYNYGIRPTGLVGATSDTPDGVRALQRWVVTAIPGPIEAATLSLYNEDNAATATNGTLLCHAILPANTGWIAGTKNAATAAVGEPCWARLFYDTVNWAGSVGCGTSGTDYAVAILGQANWIDGTAAWLGLTLSAAVVEGWRTGANDGILLRPTVEWQNGYVMFWTSAEGTTASLRPKLAITYSTGGPRRRRLIAA